MNTMLSLPRYMVGRSRALQTALTDHRAATVLSRSSSGTKRGSQREGKEYGDERDGQARGGLILQRRGETILEHFRRIYLSMQSLNDQDILPVIGVTSAIAGEGRTTIATGIAAAMAADLESPVVLVEADLSHPGVHRVLGIAPQPGICEYLRGESDLSTALRQISDRLFVLPAGDAHGEASRLARQLAAGDLRRRLVTSGAMMVLDLPPILSSSYGVLASSMAESIAFVVRAGYTSDKQVEDALSRLDETMVRGLVLNGAQPQLPRWLRERV